MKSITQTASQLSALLQRCRAGDEVAWRDLVERYQSLVFSTALTTGLGEEEATEVHQLVWIELYRSLLRIREPRALPKWLIVTTRRIAYKQAAKRQRWIDSTREDLMDPRPGPDSELLLLEQRLRVEEALQALDDRCSRVLRLFFFSRGISYRRVAAEMGMKEDSIGSLRMRCLDRLREILEAIS